MFHHILALISNSLESLCRATNQMVLIVKFNMKRRKILRSGDYLCRIALIVFSLLVVMVLCFGLSQYLLMPNYEDKLKQLKNQSLYLLANRTLYLNIHNHSTHHIYIDIGCFNGDTVENFIYFTPNSHLYDIIVFEPDPFNYELCAKRLMQEKYQNYSIIIIPQVVWIRNELVDYEIGLGDKSRLHIQNSSKYLTCRTKKAC